MIDKPNGTNGRLPDLRDRIDTVDRELIRLLKERMDAVKEVAEFKGDGEELSVLDPEREERLGAAWAVEAEKRGLSGYFTGRILREILNYSRRDQSSQLAAPSARQGRCRVGFQGLTHCYSDLAISKLFALRSGDEVERVGYPSFADALEALESGMLDYVLLPVENSLTGAISEVNHLLVSRDVAIVDEEVWELEHCLAGLPGAAVGELREVRSHPVALQQCQRLVRSLRGAHGVEHFDTAGAARSVRETGDPSLGAICSAQAAEAHGLEILRRGVADRANNQTRFLLLAREPEEVRLGEEVKTTVLFAVRDHCGALADCLSAFARHGVNLTRLESRPQIEAPWDYLFLADLGGHQLADHVRGALDELHGCANYVRLLGTYPSRNVERKRVPVVITRKQPAPRPAGPKRELASGVEPRAVDVSGISIGADTFTLIAGPCAVESHEQIHRSAVMVKQHGAQILRGGAFKPRSSPYSFQGLGYEGLELLCEAGSRYELPVVTEVLHPEDAGPIAEQADMLQVGARNMQNFALLKELGKLRRPVLLKRGMSATIKELLQAAEYIMAGGNQQVVLCERGIRTFETSTRSTLDVSAIPVLKTLTHLPVIVDPSHAAGQRHLVVPLALAAVAAGADGLIVECHPNPDEALCDKDQALRAEDLERLVAGIAPILKSQGRTL